MKTFREYIEDVKELNVDFKADFVAAGKFIASGKSKEDFQPQEQFLKELEKGIKVEFEHTNNKEISERIALDHIAESWPVSYYDKLEAMEKEIEHEKSGK